MATDNLVPRLIAHLRARQYPLHSEKVLQAEIEKSLKADGFVFSREHRLSDRDIPDFFLDGEIGGIAIEIKIKGSKREIFDQCTRYCAHPEVSSLILLTGVATGFPEEINGKSCYVVSLGRAWL